MNMGLNCFFMLIKRETHILFKTFFSKLIDISCIFFTWVVVFGYFMPKEGLKVSYGPFILVGSIASFGLFETIWKATVLAQDAQDEKISDFLILPIFSSYVFVALAISWAISTAVLSIFLFPLGKLILLKRFDLSNFSIIKFSLIFITANLFYGFFALWTASLVTNLRNVEWLWARFINTIFMFGCYFYTWKSAYELSPFIGYLHFLNPLLYILEGTKASILGQKGYLPFWGCFFSLLIFIIIFSLDGIRRFKKRLDYI